MANSDKKSAEDIFAEVEPTPKGSKASQSVSKRAPYQAPVSRPPKSSLSSGPKYLIIIVGVAVIIGLLAVGYFWWQNQKNDNQNNSTPVNTNQTNANSNQSVNTNQNTNTSSNANSNRNATATNTNTANPPSNDLDRDGLTNDEEKKLGTDEESSDTDGDGLSDYQEVNIYKSNPLDSDTDKDGRSDGDEVTNGYNPAGEGKLFDFDINKAINTTS
ncbi:MAG: hypothetical protein PHH01_04465 [Patescibacteria group bacterium]|nr:hypothetical protein [Patescibacteria group bacterium]MDD5567419.1 hypothetical protein [Patescibacteria group bacterium]